MTESSNIPATKQELHGLIEESEQAVLVSIDSENNLKINMLERDDLSLEEAVALAEAFREVFESMKTAVGKKAKGRLGDVM